MGANETLVIGGLGGGSGGGAGTYLEIANNLSDLASAASARTNLGFSTLTDYVTLTGTQTLTNKTLTSPTVTSLTGTGTTTITGTTAINPTGVSSFTVGSSAGSAPIDFISRQSPTSSVYTTSTNAVIEDFALYTKSSSGTPAAGYGGKLSFYADTNGNTNRNSGYLGFAWSTATDASRTAYAEFRLVNNASLIQTVDIVPGGLNIYGTTNGVVSVRTAAAAGTWTFTLPTTDGNANEFLQTNGSGVSTWAVVTDALLSTSDITTNNVSTSKHGFAPKAPNDATKFLNGVGAWAVPSGGGSGGVGSSVVVYKGSDETVTSSTALQNDDDFSFAIGANEAWKGMVFIPGFTSSNSGGLKADFTLPSGGSGSMRAVIGSAVASTSIGGGSFGSASGTSPTGAYFITFTITNGATPGTAQFQWAQFTSNASGTVLKAGSLLQVTRTA